MQEYDIGHGLACALASVLLGLTQALGLSLVSSNLASIQGSLQATAMEAGWLTTAYFATAVSATLLLAKVRLQFGLHAFTVLGLAGFLVASSVHLFTDSLASAIFVRAALGLAAAPITALTVLYMIEAFPKPRAVAGLILGFGALQVGQPLSRIVSMDLLEIGQWHGLFLLDVALATLSLATLWMVSLKQVPLLRTFDHGDLLAFPLYASGLALLCVVTSQGTLAWWFDAPWIGQCLAGGIALLGLYVIVDLRRDSPLIDLRWVTTPYMLRFVASVLLFRIVLSEQNIAVVGLLNALGQSNDQMHALFAWVTAGTVLGFVAAVPIVGRVGPHLTAMLALAGIIAAASLDACSTSASRPVDFIGSQILMSVALGGFFAAACVLGFGPVIKGGGKYILSYLAAFSMAQFLGTLFGTALIATCVEVRRQWHYAAIAQRLTAADPVVAQALAGPGPAIARVVLGRGERTVEATRLLATQANREAVVLAYLDVFQYVAALGVLMLAAFGVMALIAARRAAVAEMATERGR